MTSCGKPVLKYFQNRLSKVAYRVDRDGVRCDRICRTSHLGFWKSAPHHWEWHSAAPLRTTKNRDFRGRTAPAPHRTPSLHRSNQSLITSMGAVRGAVRPLKSRFFVVRCATPAGAVGAGAVRGWCVCVRGYVFFGRTGYFEFLPKMQEFGAKPHMFFIYIINKIAFKRSK